MGTCLAKIRVYDARQLPQHLLCACFRCHLHVHALPVTRRVGSACWSDHSCRVQYWLSKRDTKPDEQLTALQDARKALCQAAFLLPGTFWVQCIKLSLQGLEGMCHANVSPEERLWLVLMC
jgi:hypothetical protein